MSKANNTNALSLAYAGTQENPTKVMAADVRMVKASEIKAGANALQELSFGLYFNIVDPELCTPKGIDDVFPASNRNTKNERSALKLLVETPANIIRAAWDAHITERMVKANARYTAPSLQGLAKAVKDMTSDKETKAAPIPTADRIAEILCGSGTQAQKLKAIAAIPAVEKACATLLGNMAEAA